MMKPPAMTNSTKMPLAVTRLTVHNARTWLLPVRSGVDRTVWPRASMTGCTADLATHIRNSLIALRIWPGMSNTPRSSSVPFPADGSGDGMPPGGVGPGDGAGTAGGVGDGGLVGGAG